VIAELSRSFPSELAKAREISSNVLHHVNLPEKITDLGKDALRAAVGAIFYEVFAFDGEPMFYLPEIEPAFYGAGSPTLFVMNEDGFPWIFHSREEAERRVCLHLYEWQRQTNPFTKAVPPSRSPPGLAGTYATLARDSKALEALVRERAGVLTEEQDGIAIETLDAETYCAAMSALARLLTAPPFTIRELSFDEAHAMVGMWAKPPEKEQPKAASTAMDYDAGDLDCSFNLIIDSREEPPWKKSQLSPEECTRLQQVLGRKRAKSIEEAAQRLHALVALVEELEVTDRTGRALPLDEHARLTRSSRNVQALGGERFSGYLTALLAGQKA